MKADLLFVFSDFPMVHHIVHVPSCDSSAIPNKLTLLGKKKKSEYIRSKMTKYEHL